ncbi:hypothetical protein CPB86DRAFT_829790 [Serendipita vermifera]|nr:hypothetical protein CPB86DRAFT_829790 [Serendipita vermifera]
MCLNDPGTFNLFPNYPTTYGWYQIGRSVSSGRSGSLSKAIKLSTPYRRVVTRFMDKLGAHREAIHKERRESLEILGRDLNDRDQRYPWPYHVDADFLKDFPWEEDAPVLLEYLNKVIYTNLTKDQVDEKDITSGSWYSALTLLADSLKKDPERTTKFLLPIIDHHRTKAVSESGDVTDISAHLMYSDSFMRAVWKNEALLEAFYAPYLSRKEEDNHLELFFGAPEPTDESYQEDSRFKLLTQRQGGPYSLDNMSNGILPKFKVKGSHHLRRHLVIVAVVLWFHAAKAKPPEQYEFMAVDNAPLDFSVIYSSTKIPISNRRKSGRREISFVARSIFLLSEPEIKNIISSLKQLLPGEDDQPHLDRALQRLVSKALPRSHVPRALEEDMFTILSNPKKSSIHRHFLPYSLLKAISPENSVQLTSHFVKLILEAVQEARETKGAEADSGPKITTIKQVVSTVAQPVTGFGISQMAEELSRLARMNNHPSIQEDLIRNLVRLLQNEAKVQATSQLNLLWKTLQRLAIIAGSLNETRTLSEKDWEKDELPKIVVENQRPAQLMAVNLSTLSVEDRCHWAQILEEMLSQQVLSTKRWLSELLRRHEKMDHILETVPFGPPLNAPLMNVATSYTNLFKYLPKDSWHLQILQRQIVSYVPADQLQVECASFSNSDFIWTATDEGKAFAALMTNWRSKSMDSFTTIVSLLQRHGSPELGQALKDAIDLLLQPTAMFISATDVNRRSAPWEHLRQLVWKLMPEGNMNKESREHWVQRVRPIVEWMAPVAQAACQKDERNRLLYLPLLNQIEFMLLPFPSIMMGNAAQKDFARTLLDLGAKIQDQPVALLTLPEFNSDMLLRATRLTPNATSTALHLMKEADQRTNKKESLLGHRLALEVIDKSYYTASRTDQEKATSLIWELEQHIDEGVRAISLSYARTIKRA